jgi:hypothetical protein
MSYEESLKSVSFEADASLGIYTGVPGQPGSAVPNAGNMFRFVKITGSHQVGLCTAATDVVVGILQNKPQKPGAAATVGIYGISNVIAGAAVSAGAFVAPDATGRAVTDATNGRYIALKPATVAGEMFPVLRVR